MAIPKRSEESCFIFHTNREEKLALNESRLIVDHAPDNNLSIKRSCISQELITIKLPGTTLCKLEKDHCRLMMLQTRFDTHKCSLKQWDSGAWLSKRHQEPLTAHLRPYERTDNRSLFELLSVLPTLYPNGYDWLDRRLSQVLDGNAYCTVAESQEGILGVTIETPKAADRVKLSTIFVKPGFRSLGIGKRLLSRCHDRWKDNEVKYVYVTVAAHIAPYVSPILTKRNFKLEGCQQDRYGCGRDELIYSWEPI